MTVPEAIFYAAFARLGPRLMVVGLAGSQGSGKSTMARAVMAHCAERKIAAATLSLDDLYLTRQERLLLARDVHPLLETRGVPGTHDVTLGLDVLDRLARGEPTPLPRFDKASDDRLPQSAWQRAPHDCRLLLLEGWCVGAIPQRDADLVAPVNELEAYEDSDGIWRRYANNALATDYQRLFERIDLLAMLAAPSFDVVYEWRLEQEDELRTRGGTAVMDAAQVARFVQHYERLTRHMLAEMPSRADVLVELDAARAPIAIRTAAVPR